MKPLMLVGIGLLCALLTFAMNWLALIPWRRAKGKHWSERARVYYPARVAAVSNLWVLPTVASMSVVLLFPEHGPHWALVALVASVGTLVGTIPMDREVSPRTKLARLWRQVAIGWIIRFLLWFVFLGGAALMPQEFNFLTIIIPVVVLCLLIWWNQSGWIRVSQWLGLMSAAPERLVNIVQNTAAKMNISFHEVLLLRTDLAQAYALPGRRTLLFSERLFDILTDDEIGAVTAHELAHLTEARGDSYKRYIVWLVFLPWLFLKPMIHNFNFAGYGILLVTTILAPRIFRKISHKLEVRADNIAHANEPDSGTYARALAKLYEDNLAPAVNAKDRSTHPHLYDRMLAAGVTPDFPRPAPTSAMSINGILLSAALGILAAILILQSNQ